jgi:hypothetical protein
MILQGLSVETLARLMALARHEGDSGGRLAELEPPDPETASESASDFRFAAE